MARRIPSKISSYEVLDLLGQGGMGRLYRAWQPELERTVVLKALRRDRREDASLEERFLREARAAAAIHHSNVVGVYDCFVWRGERYIAQEYVDGDDLLAVMGRAQVLDPRVAGLISLATARGLEEIHARGVIHRDLKPSNVMLGRDGEIKIADFGIALDRDGPALTMVGHAVGTPPYMSPEAMMGEELDPRSDLFSFGVMLYEMLTGEPPFLENDRDFEGSLLSRMKDSAYHPVRQEAADVPRWMAGVIKQCLQYKPEKRFASATELRKVLEDKLGSPSPADCRAENAMWMWERNVFAPETGETLLLDEEDEVYRSWIWRPRWWGAIAGLTALLVAGGGVTLREHPEWIPRGVAQSPLFPGSWFGMTMPGIVHIEAMPWAEVSIDGGEAARTPLPGPVEVTPGEHVVKFVHPELGEQERVIQVLSGQEVEVKCHFRKRGVAEASKAGGGGKAGSEGGAAVIEVAVREGGGE